MSTLIIILNWNNAEDTIECLKSVLAIKNNRSRFDVAVVDNFSSDDSWSVINKQIEQFGYFCQEPSDSILTISNILELKHFVSSERENPMIYFARSVSNLGFAGGNNNGINIGLKLGVEYFWIINNDVIVNSDAFYFLENKVRKEKKIGICGANIKEFGEPGNVQCLGGYYFDKFSGRGFAIKPSISEPLLSNSEVESKLTYICGACMFVRKEFILTVGLLDERFFLYCEEADWAYRAEGKFSLGVEKRAVVYHKEGATIGTASANNSGSAKSEFYQARSKLLLTHKHNRRFLIPVFSFQMLRAFKLLLRRDYDCFIAILKACLFMRL